MSESVPRVRIPGTLQWTSSAPERVGRGQTEHRLLARDVVRIVFFMPCDYFELATAVTHALDTYLRAIEGQAGALARYVCCYSESYALGDRGWELIRKALEPKERGYADDDGPHEEAEPLKDGADPYVVLYGEQDSGYCFDSHARLPWREPPPDKVSVLRVTLPTEYLEQRGPECIRELALDLAAQLPFVSGHAGLALEYWGSLHDRLALLHPVIFRHPGFDLRNATIHDDLGSQVDGVHWLNFFGPPVLAPLGGAASLRARLQDSTTRVQELAGERALVMLGPHPEAGDLLQGHTLPAYRELARALEPWLEPFPWSFLERQGRGMEERELRRWWRRFLDG